MSFAAWIGGKTSRTMTSRPRPRYVWNIFCAIYGTIILLIFGFIFHQILCELIYYKTEQTFLSYNDNIITTSLDSFVVSPSDSDVVNDLQSLDEGTEVVIEVSKMTGEVIEVSTDQAVIYQIRKVSYGIIIVAALFFVFLFSALVFMLYVVNAKNPPKFIRKEQRKLVL